jgi:hypothetical protein
LRIFENLGVIFVFFMGFMHGFHGGIGILCKITAGGVEVRLCEQRFLTAEGLLFILCVGKERTNETRIPLCGMSEFVLMP